MKPQHLRAGQAYIAATSIAYLVLVPILQIARHLSGSASLVEEYYWTNGSKAALADIFLVGIYLVIGRYVASLVPSVPSAAAVALTAAGISSCFCIYFRSRPRTKRFFSRWFHKAGWGAVLYDAIYLGLVDVLYNWYRN